MTILHWGCHRPYSNPNIGPHILMCWICDGFTDFDSYTVATMNDPYVKFGHVTKWSKVTRCNLTFLARQTEFWKPAWVHYAQIAWPKIVVQLGILELQGQIQGIGQRSHGRPIWKEVPSIFVQITLCQGRLALFAPPPKKMAQSGPNFNLGQPINKILNQPLGLLKTKQLLWCMYAIINYQPCNIASLHLKLAWNLKYFSDGITSLNMKRGLELSSVV